jgi:hypothetical protein
LAQDHAAELKTISELLDRVPAIYELAWGDLRRAKGAAFECERRSESAVIWRSDRA